MKKMLAAAVGACVMWTAAPLYASQIVAKDILRTDEGSVVEGTTLATKANLDATESALQSEIKTTESALQSEIKTTESALQSEIKTTESALQSEIKTTETVLRSEIKTTEDALNSKIEATETRLNTKIEAAETRLRAEIQILRSEMRWLFGLLVGVFLAAAGFLWKMLSDLKAQFAALAERMQIAAPTINPAPDGQGHFDLTAAGNKTEAD